MVLFLAGGMFGQGIYSSPISSSKYHSGSIPLIMLIIWNIEADTYVKNHHTRSHLHAMLLCQVVGDEPQFMYQADNFMRSPDFGYNCVCSEAELYCNSGLLTLLYRLKGSRGKTADHLIIQKLSCTRMRPSFQLDSSSIHEKDGKLEEGWASAQAQRMKHDIRSHR